MDLFDTLIEAYTEVEVAKAHANASGKEHTQQKLTVERANAAAIQVEKPSQTAQAPTAAKPTDVYNLGGVQVNKTLAIGGGVLLLAGFTLMAFKKK